VWWDWAHYWPIVPAPDDRWWWLWCNWWNEDWQGKLKYSEKTCPSATLSTKNPTRPDPGSNSGRCGGKPASNRLSYGVASGKNIMLETFYCHPFGIFYPLNRSSLSFIWIQSQVFQQHGSLKWHICVKHYVC
jgi:hypothetical protein